MDADPADVVSAAIEALRARVSELEAERDNFKHQMESAGGTMREALAERDALREALEPERLARAFHEAYERLAPSFDYETLPTDTAVAWDTLPLMNKRLMVASIEAALVVAQEQKHKLKATGDEPLDVVNSGSEDWLSQEQKP